MQSINNFSLVKTVIENAMHTRVLRRTIVFLRVRCSIYGSCSILILLIKIFRFTIPHCILILSIRATHFGSNDQTHVSKYMI